MWRRIGLRVLVFVAVAFAVLALTAATTGITTRQTRTAAPGNFAGSNSEGTSLSHARADHVHTATSTAQTTIDPGAFFGTTPGLQVDASGILFGDPLGGQTQTEGVWLGFNDFGVAHSTIKQLPTGETIRMCGSSASGPPNCNSGGQLDFTFAEGRITSSGTNKRLELLGNKNAADGGTDIILSSTATRTAGHLLDIQNNGTNRVFVEPSGNTGWTNSNPILYSADTNSTLELRGQKNAADAGSDLLINTFATRTSGNLLKVQNAGADRFTVDTAGGIGVRNDLAFGFFSAGSLAGQITQFASNSPIVIRGNRSAADAGSEHILNSTVTRTAGFLLEVQNNSANKLRMKFDGTLHMPDVAAVAATGTNASIILYGNKNAADSGTDVLANSQATRTAGNLLAVQNNGTDKARVFFNGVVDAPNVMRISETTADDVVTGSTMQSVTGLSFPVAANADYYAEFTLLANTAAVAIHNVQFTGPAIGTGKVRMGAQGIFGTTVSGFGAAAYSTLFQIQPANITTESIVRIYFILRNGANSGTVQLQHANNSGASNSTIFAGSNVRWQRADNAGLP